MAGLPLWNGSARVNVDNNPANSTLLDEYTFRASTASLTASQDTVVNSTFEAKGNVAITVNWRVDNILGSAGIQTDAPNFGHILIFTSDDNTNSTAAGSVFDSGDVIGGNALPRSGSFTFTPNKCGTYRLALYFGQTGSTPQGRRDWSAQSDGAFTAQALSTIVRTLATDKGRLRYGTGITSLTITRTPNNDMPALFAFTSLAAEGVKIVEVQDIASHTGAAPQVFQIQQRRNGTVTIDDSLTTTIDSITQQETNNAVNLINYPTATSQLYDSILLCQAASNLHTNNVPQYTGLGGQAASGNWTYFTDVGAGLTLTDYQTITKLSTHTVNSNGSIENNFCHASDTYNETSGIPNPPEANPAPSGPADYIATDKNMTVKCGRVLNARGEILVNVFSRTQVIHENSGVVRDSWGIDDNNFQTGTNGWQNNAHVVVVSTPPSGLHDVLCEAYWPVGTLILPPTQRQFYTKRLESGSPAGVDTGKNWIAPASFMGCGIVLPNLVVAGTMFNFSVHVFNRAVEADADTIPPCMVYKNRVGGASGISVVLTKRVGTTGIYDGSFTTDAWSGTPDIYEIAASPTVSSTTKTYSDTTYAVLALPAPVPPDVDPTPDGVTLQSINNVWSIIPNSIGDLQLSHKIGFGGGVKFVGVEAKEHEKKREALIKIVEKGYTKEDLDRMIADILERVNQTQQGNARLSEDEEALLLILMALNEPITKSI